MLDMHLKVKKRPGYKALKKKSKTFRHELKMLNEFLQNNKQKSYTYNQIKHILGKSLEFGSYMKVNGGFGKLAKHIEDNLRFKRK